ncbi:hypothetical protein [Paraglaciecola aestuariivivens]
MLDKRVSFHREYSSYTGGHQKVFDYLNHTKSCQGYAASLYVIKSSKVNPHLFDDVEGVEYTPTYRPDLADIAFLAGMDWQAYQAFYSPNQIKINLIQHVRHADNSQPLFQFLQHKAIRICVSEAVKEAIEPYANGPCFVIKMGHDIPKLKLAKHYDLYILATKQPELGRQLYEWANKIGLKVLIHDKATEREQVYQAMAQSKVAIPLPHNTEGFFLPGIEAMALADWAVVPDCVASREYSHNWANVSSCELNLFSCKQAIEHALKKTQSWTLSMHQWRGQAIVSQYNLQQERLSFHQILTQVEDVW